MSSTLILSLALVIQTKPQGVQADEFGLNFVPGARAFAYMESAEAKPLSVPAASSREVFQRTIHLYSIITESRNSVDPLPNPPSAQDAAKAEAELAAMEKRGEISRVDAKTPVLVLSSEVIVTDTLRNQQAQKKPTTGKDPGNRSKTAAETLMRICRVKITVGKSKDSEVWVWNGYLVGQLTKAKQVTATSSNTRQKELQATLDKRKALAAKKKALSAARTAKERAAAQKAYDQALRDLPAQTAEQNRMLQQQALEQEFLMRQQQAQAQSGVQIGVPIAPAGGAYP